MSMARTSRSNTAGPTIKSIGCRQLVADLVHRRVAVIVASGGRAPGVRGQGGNHHDTHRLRRRRRPGQLGLVSSLARSGGNATGINFFNLELAAKRLELLRELAPAAIRVAVLVDPTNSAAESTVGDLEVSARAMGLQIHVVNASTSGEIDAAFATLIREQPNALFIGGGAFFTSRRVQLVHLASRHAIPATYAVRDYAEAGGLMTYGTNVRMRFVRSASTPAASSRARSPWTCRSCKRRSSSWSSTCKRRNC